MTSLAPPDSPHDSAQSFEEGSSSGGTSSGYLTPDEFAGDEDEALLDEEMRVCILMHSEAFLL